MASSDRASLALMGWPDMTVALAKLASPGSVSSQVGRAIRIFPYVFIRENSDCYAAWVSDVWMLSNFAQVNNLPRGTKLSPGLTKYMKFMFCLPQYCTGWFASGTNQERCFIEGLKAWPYKGIAPPISILFLICLFFIASPQSAQPSVENFHLLRRTPSHADALNSVHCCTEFAQVCAELVNKKLCQIYCICLRKIFCWPFLVASKFCWPFF